MFTKPTLKTALALATGLLMLTGCDNDDDDGPGTQQPSAPGDSYPSGTVHCIEGGTAVVEVLNPETGKTWMDRNLGASQVATSSTDEAAYGDLYQWGRFSDGHQCRTSSSTSTISSSNTPGHDEFILSTDDDDRDWRNPQNDSLWQGVSGINNPCPQGYRIPTDAEFNAERETWVSNNMASALASPLKLPAAGLRLTNGSLFFVGDGGFYWNSGVSGHLAGHHRFGSTAIGINGRRALGYSVRCIKD